MTRAGKTSVVGAPDWQATRKAAARNGYDLQVFGPQDAAGKGAPAATGEAFESALKNSEVVVYVDHGVPNPYFITAMLSELSCFSL